MHRYPLELVSIPEDEIGMKLQAALAKASEDSNNVLWFEQFHD